MFDFYQLSKGVVDEKNWIEQQSKSVKATIWIMVPKEIYRVNSEVGLDSTSRDEFGNECRNAEKIDIGIVDCKLEKHGPCLVVHPFKFF